MTPFQALIIWVPALVVATIVGGRKGRRGAGFLLGLLSWIGVVIIAVMPPTHDMLVLREEERLQVQREARDG